ncbi:glycosyltransferase [archaeon]|nr:glycosyltransferase [archaeon]
MRIAQVIIGYHPRVGGYGRHVNLISKGLRSRGREVRILTTSFSPGVVKEEEGVKRFWNTPFLKVTPGLLKHLVNADYDLVHVHGYPSFQPFITRLAKKRAGFPLVFTPHYHPFGNKPRFVRRAFDKVFGEPSLRAADKVIALTDYEKGLLAKIVSEDRISVIPNPVNLSELKRVKGFKKKHGLGSYVLFVGRLESGKGLDYLVEAVGDNDLVVIGRDAGAAFKVKPNVHVLGEVSQEELMMAYTECSLLALPSRYEAFGIVLIEAMSYGKPVIGTKAGPVPSIINKAGLTVPYGDVRALRRAIKKVLANPGRFSRHARKQAEQYDVKRVVDKLLKVYEVVL